MKAHCDSAKIVTVSFENAVITMMHNQYLYTMLIVLQDNITHLKLFIIEIINNSLVTD